MSDDLRARVEAVVGEIFEQEMRCPTCGSHKFGGDGQNWIQCHGWCERESTYAKWEAQAVRVLRSGVDVEAVLEAALRELAVDCAESIDYRADVIAKLHAERPDERQEYSVAVLRDEAKLNRERFGIKDA